MNVKIIVAAVAVAAAVGIAATTIICGRGSDGHDFYALKEFFFEGDFSEFRSDMFWWYKSVEREDGVMLCNTSFYDKELLDGWRSNGIYENVPDKGFTYAAASPSYLDEIGVKPLDGGFDKAWDGVRLYLLPDTLDDNEAEKMRAFLEEDALKEADHGGITNGFTERREIAFLEYAPADSEDGGAPVYYVCTTENMTSFESESLFATGGDSYIRLRDESVLDRYKNERVFTVYSLKFAKESEIY